MQKRKHSPWPSLLMLASLGLLAAFEFFWLKSEYENARTELNEQQTRRLHGAIRELEDSLFQVKVWTPFKVNKDSLDCDEPRLRFAPGEMPDDSGHVFTVMRSVEVSGGDTIKIRRHRPKHAMMMLGTLSAQIGRESGEDSLQITVEVPQLIAGKLQAMRGPEDLNFDLVSWETQVPDSTGMLSKPYFDVLSGMHYAIEYPKYKGYLLQSILPQVIFAVLLFACIAGAFWAISRSLIKQQRLAEIRSNLIANITHELKTPIATVHVALEALQTFDADLDTSRREEYIGIAKHEMQRLAMLVDNVLKNSNSNQAHTEIKVERFDLRELLAHVLDTLKMQFGKLSASVNLDTSGEDFTIEADRLQITGLIHNLVDNALKYGGQHPEINIHLEQLNGSYILKVRDHGIGIPEEYRGRIFEKFFRVPSGDTHNIKGHGLGLSYVAEVVREHGGAIDVQSMPGTGTTFKVTLPRIHAN